MNCSCDDLNALNNQILAKINEIQSLMIVYMLSDTNYIPELPDGSIKANTINFSNNIINMTAYINSHLDNTFRIGSAGHINDYYLDGNGNCTRPYV
jgi:hypothetical protein